MSASNFADLGGMTLKSKLAAILLLLFSVMMTVFPAAAISTNIITGQCGESVYYEYNSDTGSLRIYGSGDMYSYKSEMDTPFLKLKGYFGDAPINHLTIENGVTSIGKHAFGTDYLTNKKIFRCSTVIIPSSVKRIEAYAFAFLPYLKTVILREGVESIGEFAFGCDMFDYAGSSERVIYIPKSVTYIYGRASYWNSEAVYYEGTLKDFRKLISNHDPNSSLEHVVFFSQPMPVFHHEYEYFGTWVSDYSYSYLTKKTTKLKDQSNITLQSDGTIIVNDVEGTWSLVDGEVLVDEESVYLSMNNDNNLFMRLDGATIVVFKRTDETAKYSEIRLPSEITSIDKETFAGTNADVYVLHEGITEIKSGSFSNLSRAKYIVIPQSLTVIDENAFDGTNNAVYLCPSMSCYAYGWLSDHGKNVRIEPR